MIGRFRLVSGIPRSRTYLNDWTDLLRAAISSVADNLARVSAASERIRHRRWARRATRRQPRRRGVAPPEGDAAADSKDLQQQSKALDKLTDHVEDRQLDSSRVQSVCFWLTQHYPSIDPLLRCIATKTRVGIGNLFVHY
jgi:hypothetical protein